MKLPIRGLLCCPQFLSVPHPIPSGHSSGTLLSFPQRRLCLPAGGWLRFQSLRVLCPHHQLQSEVGSAVGVTDPGSLKHFYTRVPLELMLLASTLVFLLSVPPESQTFWREQGLRSQTPWVSILVLFPKPFHLSKAFYLFKPQFLHL